MVFNIDQLNQDCENRSSVEILRYFSGLFGNKLSFASSLGAEDQVITEMIARNDINIRIFTLDTGRLFQETYDLIDITEKKYNIKIDVIFPDAAKVEEMVKQKGINLFYDSIGNRKLCCNIRKIEPLQRALSNSDAWISGLRKDQSVTRKDLKVVEADEKNGKIKISPLINWTEGQVWDYIRSNKVPYNTLHDKGYPSIGCLPCTRAVLPGEDIRSGRWWWESPENKECGLHK